MEKIQAFMNEVYHYWNSDAGKDKSKNDILLLFPSSREMAVRFGNFNYQTHNGGATQWIGNRYMEEDIDRLIDFCEEGIRADIEGFHAFFDLFLQVKKDMDGFEDETEEECAMCDGEGETECDDADDLPYDDEEAEKEFEEKGYVKLSCEECGGAGTVTMENDYPKSVQQLEDHLFKIGEQQLFKMVETLIDYRLAQEEELGDAKI